MILKYANDSSLATYIFVGPPSILQSSIDLVMRDIIAGGPPVVLSCSSTGMPLPHVLWFYNSISIPISNSSGVLVTAHQLTISYPVTTKSGMYQCFVDNGVSAPLNNVQRTWIVEISEPSMVI